MRISQILEHYPKQIDAARAIDISPQLMSKLRRQAEKEGKEIPVHYQIKWEVATGGVLRADLPEEIRAA